MSKKPMSIARHRGYKNSQGQQLTKKEDLFVEAFMGLAQGNAYKACQLAGYADSTEGYRILKRKEIQNEIALRTLALAEAGAALTPQEIHSKWRQLSNHPDKAIALRATENAAKALGMFVQRTEVRNIDQPQAGIGQADQFLQGLSNEELEVFIEFVRLKKANKVIDVTPQAADAG